MPFLYSSTLEPNAAPTARYVVPFKGVNRVLPLHMLPPDALYEGHNVCIRHGTLRSRPGLTRQMTENQPFGLAMASILFIAPDGIKRPLLLTTNSFSHYVDGDWQRIGALPQSLRDHPGSLTTLETENIVYVIISNGVSPLRWWSLSTALAPVPKHADGMPTPVLKDITTASNRIIGIQLPYKVLWSQYLAPDYWRASNVAILADTEDEIIAVKSLGTLGFVVYKAGSIWAGFPQAGSDANAFRFELFGLYEGPASNQSIVDVNGTHVYMTPSGRIGAYDGSQQKWLADGLWPFLANDLDPAYVKRIRCSYTYLHDEVTFYYPRLGDAGKCRGIVTINLPYPEQGVESFAPFQGSTHLDVTATLSIRLFQGDRNPLVYTADERNNTTTYHSSGEAYKDDIQEFECILQPGLHTSQEPMSQTIHKPIFELYALRDETRGLIDIYEVHSGLLSKPGGTIEEKPLTIDLTRDALNQFYAFNDANTYLGFQIRWFSEARLHYLGINFYARPLA